MPRIQWLRLSVAAGQAKPERYDPRLRDRVEQVDRRDPAARRVDRVDGSERTRAAGCEELDLARDPVALRRRQNGGAGDRDERADGADEPQVALVTRHAQEAGHVDKGPDARRKEV